MIRVILPQHLQVLANCPREVVLEVPSPVTQRTVLTALEGRYPALKGTIRDHVTQQRRPLVRFFACQEDLSHESPDAPLPDRVASGQEPYFIIGAIAGGLDLQAQPTMSTRALPSPVFLLRGRRLRALLRLCRFRVD